MNFYKAETLPWFEIVKLQDLEWLRWIVLPWIFALSYRTKAAGGEKGNCKRKMHKSRSNWRRGL